MAHRIVKRHGLALASQHSPLRPRSGVLRSRVSHVSQTRQLWWWGRHRNEFRSTIDEHLEDRMYRQQRILKQQYSRMLKRRALWERESDSRLSWPWKLSHRWLGAHSSDVQYLSSSQAPKSKMEEPREGQSKPDSPLTTFHKDFESFKKAVDRAIERDPYGTLFGRRLQSPPTANNSSWTSFSWIFDPKEIKEESPVSQKPASPAPSEPISKSAPVPERMPRTETQSVQSSRIPTSQSAAVDEYEYDPISMRKVPKTIDKAAKSLTDATEPKLKLPESPKSPPSSQAEEAEPTRKTFFEALFGEHGVAIPVKTYKPHKVYGYGTDSQSDKPREKESSATKVGFETSRKREFMALKAARLGNTIDTTAEYFGKYTPDAEKSAQQLASAARNQAAPPDDAPLFSGTTYEGKSDEIVKSAQSGSEWLRKEGFCIDQKSPEDVEDVEILVEKFKPRMESSLDRVQARVETRSKPQPTQLQSALDRQTQVLRSKVPPQTLQTSTERPKDERPEDLEFLRASDVRAATRSSRVTKQEKEQQKIEARKKLEEDFSSRDHQEETDQPFTSTHGRSLVSKSLDNVWKHVQEYPNGIVARTVKSMGIFNENWKKYVRPEPRVDLNKPLDFKTESLSKLPSIHKPWPKRLPSFSFQPSDQVLEAQLLNRLRTAGLREANKVVGRTLAHETAQLNELARTLKTIIDAKAAVSSNFRQAEQEESDLRELASSAATNTRPHALSTASVKEGVPHYPSIEAYTTKFEPEYAKLVQEAKGVRRELFNAQIQLRYLRNRMESQMEEEAPISKDVQPQVLPERSSAQELDARFEQSMALGTPANVPEPVFTPDGSLFRNDEHPPLVSELKEAFSSPFVILKYNRETGSVSRLTAHFHEAGDRRPPSPLKILARLHHPEKFFPYFSALEQANYEIVSSNSDTLIFRKMKDPTSMKQAEQNTQQMTPEEVTTPSASQEAADAPSPTISVAPPPKHAATVLDEIPVDVEPVPGPAAPTAPPSGSTSKPSTRPTPSSTPRVRRQEDLFSGTRTAPLSQTVNPIDPETSAPWPFPSHWDEHPPVFERPVSGFRRFLRTLKRVFLTTFTVGAGAYVVGVVTEGLDAKTQQKAIRTGDSGEAGPRKKIVMSGQRPGIFSTESSR